jgi:hypothetical protein
MLRRLQTFMVLMVWSIGRPAAAQLPPDEQTSAASQPAEEETTQPNSEAASAEPTSGGATSAATTTSPEPPDTSVNAEATADIADGKVGVELADPAEPPAAAAAESEAEGGSGASGLGDWDVFMSGYFRAPMALGISTRTGPDDLKGEPDLQVSYGPNRTVDSNYYSFAYTRLQEQDWAEVFIHAKKKHAEAVVGWMGYWFQSASFRNLDAGWLPGMAYLTLDSDVDLGGITPNVALTAGAWWPSFGYFSKYDTLTLGRFRMVGEQLKITVPVGDLKATLYQGFGTGRDGSFTLLSPPPYQAKVGLDLLHYEHLELAYKDYVQVGVHYNSQWTRDPRLFATTQPGKAFTDAKEAYMNTLGGELKVNASKAGVLWVSPAYIKVRNGWALANAGTEVMHSIGAEGVARNYFGWSGSLRDSTGSGSLLNVGFAYENSLRRILGASDMPEVRLSAFGLFADVSIDLPETSAITQDHIGQFKYGADLEFLPVDWFGLMARWDEVNYNLDHAGFIFSAMTARMTFSTHFLSGESIYLQYSRYHYGDAMVLSGTWPWGTPLVAGTDILQGGTYAGQTPDMDVIKVQASIVF